MAEMNQNGRGEFFESDPFAELTRILGNSPATPKPSDASTNVEDDLSLDLERELMGELDASQFEVEAENEAIASSAVQPQAPTAYDASQSTAYQAEEDYSSDFGDLESALENEMYSQFEGGLDESVITEPEHRFDDQAATYTQSADQVFAASEAPAFYAEPAATVAEPQIADFDFSELEAELDNFATELPEQAEWQAEPTGYDPAVSIVDTIPEQPQDAFSPVDEQTIDFSEFEAELASIETVADPESNWQVESAQNNQPEQYEIVAPEETISVSEHEEFIAPADVDFDFSELESELVSVEEPASQTESWALTGSDTEQLSTPEFVSDFSGHEVASDHEIPLVQAPQNFDFSDLEAELAALDNPVPQANTWSSNDTVHEPEAYEADDVAFVATSEETASTADDVSVELVPDFGFSDFASELTVQGETEAVAAWQEAATAEPEEVVSIANEPVFEAISAEEVAIEDASPIDFGALRAQLADFNGTPEIEEAPAAANWWDQPVEATQDALTNEIEVADLPDIDFDIPDVYSDDQSVALEHAAIDAVSEESTDAPSWGVEEVSEQPSVRADDHVYDVELDFDFLDAELTTSAEDIAAVEQSFDAPDQAAWEPQLSEPTSVESYSNAATAAAAAYASRSTSSQTPPASEFGRANFSAPSQRAQDSFSDRSKIVFSSGAATSAFSNAVRFTAPETEINSNTGQDTYAPQSAPLAYEEELPAYTSDESGVPDIETIDFSDTATPVFNDLDIPEIDYEPSVAKTLNEFESEFSQVFGDTLVANQASAFASTPAAQQPEGEPSFSEPSDNSDAYSLDDWQARGGFENSKYDFENELERALAVDGYEDEGEAAEKEPRKRSTLIAAVIAGVAIVGGIGVFGMSFFGGTGSDGPVLIRADNEPLRVRPENPGGSNVPNQNSEVYQRVGGNQTSNAPGQERLVTTAEQPVDVLARSQEPGALPPGVTDSSLAGLGADNGGQPKSEDRLEPAQTSSSASPEEIGAVTPRRVRTMIVRPDGTMVPREEVAAAPTTVAPALAPANPASGTQQNVPSLDEATTLVAPTTEEGGPVVVTPATVAAVPTPRPSTASAQQAVAQPQAQPVAAPQAAPTQVAAAPSQGESAWSMQIASQPTAEGAQTAYQDLARRYSSVLQGRGVNIVSANIEGRGTFYRVRIPAQTREEAVQLCTRYQAAGGSCFVSR